jgi:quercetin dioxygenase-like cupin family protein
MSIEKFSFWKCGVAATALALSLFAAASWAEHSVVKPADLKWNAVPSLPPGAQIAVIEGPMNQAVPFTIRLKLPANYRIPPHTHPAVERVTVLSGVFNIGMGDKFDQAKTQSVEPGGIVILHPGTAHFASTTKETVVQLHGTGPWGVTYVNPSDDPRKN